MFSAEHLHLPDSLVPTGNSRLLWGGKEGRKEQSFAGRSLPLAPAVSAQASSVANPRYWSSKEYRKQERVS